MLKVIVDILAMLIGAEGARLLREYGAGETPQGRSPEEAVSTRGKRSRLERKSTGKYNTAKK
ncbi:hypothetical protein [Neobacillus drentensis]|uniref:hypothetical protein n=1 Tax=Neobacillus drentensis TaxID=220684 RepID=UPI002FFEC7D4